MSMRSKRGMTPTDVVLPITPMLDMSFQLLFFFICIYKPPQSAEAQFILNLNPPKTKDPTVVVQSSGSGGSQSSDSKSVFDEKDPLPVAYNIKLDVYTHVSAGTKDVDDLIIENIKVSGVPDKNARAAMKDRGLITNVNQEPLEITAPPNSDGQITLETEKAIMEKIPQILEEAKRVIPVDSATPTVTILAPRELRTYKVVRLMDYANKFGFSLALQVARR